MNQTKDVRELLYNSMHVIKINDNCLQFLGPGLVKIIEFVKN